MSAPVETCVVNVGVAGEGVDELVFDCRFARDASLDMEGVGGGGDPPQN